MLTFIDKNEVYSERKFDEVSVHHHIFNLYLVHTLYTHCLGQLSDTIKGLSIWQRTVN